MTTEINKTTNVNDPFQPATNSGITRRSFFKRTAATILLTALAVNAFATEPAAADGGASSIKHYTIRYDGGSLPATEAFLAKQVIPQGIFSVMVDGKLVPYNVEVTLLVSQAEKTTSCAGIEVGDKAASWTFTGTVTIEAKPTAIPPLPTISVTASGQVVKYLAPDTNQNPFYTGSEGGSMTDSFGSVGITARVDWNKDGFVLAYTVNGATSSPAITLQLPVVEK